MSGRDGPSVVAVGGGRGLATTLRAVRRYAGYTTAVVATADDSGSTGRLRESMGMPAPGDLRRCLTAIAGVEDGPLGRAIEYRFAGTDVEGHTLGNLLLAGLLAVTGDLVSAAEEVSRLLGLDPAVGRVLPATVGPVELRATTLDGSVVVGQYAVSQTAGIERVWLCPGGAGAPRGVAEAIVAADQVVLGPGSVYTSVLAAALVEEVRQALAVTRARRVYVCNLAPEHAETLGYDVAAHLAALRAHGVTPDLVLVDGPSAGESGTGGVPAASGAPPAGGGLPLGDVDGDVEVVTAHLAHPGSDVHDSHRLAAALAALVPCPAR